MATEEMETFLCDGMGKYKQASATLVAFGKAIEARLHQILKARPADSWGAFVPDVAKEPKRSQYWSKYPLLNAVIDGSVGETSVRIWIAVNWYDAEDDYPFYWLWPEPADHLIDGMNDFGWLEGVERFKRGLRMEPTANDFDLERDFGILLDEFERFLTATVA